MGYFGFSYYVENKSRLKPLSVHNGTQCVAPSIASAGLDVQAALAATLRLREADFLPAVGRSSVHQVHHRERASHRTGFPLRLADGRAAEEGQAAIQQRDQERLESEGSRSRWQHVSSLPPFRSSERHEGAGARTSSRASSPCAPSSP